MRPERPLDEVKPTLEHGGRQAAGLARLGGNQSTWSSHVMMWNQLVLSWLV